MTEAKPYDVTDTLPDLDAGLFIRKLSRALADTALAVVNQDGKSKKGQVTVTFSIGRLSDNGNQVVMEHKLAYSRPTKRGKASEQDSTETAMYVSGNGSLTLLPFKQSDLFRQPEPTTPQGNKQQ